MPEATTPVIEQLLTPTQVRSLLVCSDKKLRRLVRAGELPCTRVGRSLRFSPSEVAGYLAARRTGQPRPTYEFVSEKAVAI